MERFIAVCGLVLGGWLIAAYAGYAGPEVPNATDSHVEVALDEVAWPA